MTKHSRHHHRQPRARLPHSPRQLLLLPLPVLRALLCRRCHRFTLLIPQHYQKTKPKGCVTDMPSTYQRSRVDKVVDAFNAMTEEVCVSVFGNFRDCFCFCFCFLMSLSTDSYCFFVFLCVIAGESRVHRAHRLGAEGGS